jgi:hypothetical protein
MCAIIGWQGHMPRGFLSRLILESGSRGKDSTGVAFYGKFKDKNDGNFMGIGAYKDAVEPIDFIQDDDVKKILSDARRSPAGGGISGGWPVLCVGRQLGLLSTDFARW